MNMPLTLSSPEDLDINATTVNTIPNATNMYAIPMPLGVYCTGVTLYMMESFHEMLVQSAGRLPESPTVIGLPSCDPAAVA